MKRHLLFLLLAFQLTCSIAQIPRFGMNGGDNKGNTRTEFSPELYMKSMQSFVAREAALTEFEKAKFFPLLTEMLDKQRELMERQRQLMMDGMKQNASEEDYERLITRQTALEVEIRKVEQAYYKKFNSVLSWKKIYAVRTALSRFQMVALSRFQPGGTGNPAVSQNPNRNGQGLQQGNGQGFNPWNWNRR